MVFSPRGSYVQELLVDELVRTRPSPQHAQAAPELSQHTHLLLVPCDKKQGPVCDFAAT